MSTPNPGKLIKTSTDLTDVDVDFTRYRKTSVTLAIQIPHPFVVTTLHGPVFGKAGDYLMQGPGGKKDRYPCDREVFAATYERMPDLHTPPPED